MLKRLLIGVVVALWILIEIRVLLGPRKLVASNDVPQQLPGHVSLSSRLFYASYISCIFLAFILLLIYKP